MNDMSNPPTGGGSGQLYLQALQGIVQAVNALISPLTNVVQRISGISVLGNSGTAAATAAPIIGTAAQVLRVNDAGTALGFGPVDLVQSAAVTGTLPVANGGTAQATAAAARAASGLNVESGTGRGDANYTILATDRYVFTNAAFTAARTFTLPAANAVNPGAPLVVADVQGTVTPTNTLSLAPNGTDKIDGANATVVALRAAKQMILLWSDGVANWKTTGGLSDSSSWSTYTPVVTAGSGTFTSVSANGRFKAIGKTIFFNVSISITTNGTAATNVQATLPTGSPTVISAAVGQEVNVTGKMVVGFINSSGGTVSCRYFDNTYPGGDGTAIVVNGFYEVP